MDENLVLKNLCYYDNRNPDHDPCDINLGFVKKDPCFCDNCFYGRDRLANEILRLKKEITDGAREEKEDVPDLGHTDTTA